MQKTIQTTGSKNLSEIARECGITEGEFTLTIQGNASPVAGSFAKPTVRLAAADFFLALAGAGIVGESLLARAVEFSAARAEGREVAPACAAAAERLGEKAEAMAKEWAAKLPPIERPATVRIKASVSLA